MIAVKFYGQNGIGAPEQWPLEVRHGVSVLPAGFDVLVSRAAYDAHLAAHRSAFEEWQAAQPSAPAPTPNESQVQDAEDAAEAVHLLAVWQKFVDGTITVAEQRRVLKWLFRVELRRRGLMA